MSEQRIRACVDPETLTIYAIVASQDFALFYKIEPLPNKLTLERNTPCHFNQIVTICKASNIAVINTTQVAIYSKLDLVVVDSNFKTPKAEIAKAKVKISEINFKLKFTSPIHSVGIVSNVIVIDYGPSSVLFDVGMPMVDNELDDALIENDKIKSLNQLAATYKRCLKSFGISGYISITEEKGRWQQYTKHTPLNVHAADLLTLDNLTDQSFDETILA